MQLRGARNGDDPRLLREQPRERDLRRRRVLALRRSRRADRPAPDSPFAPRARTAEGCCGSRCCRTSCSRRSCPVRKPLPSGLNGTKPMPSSSSVGKIFCFRLSRPPQRVFALHCSDRLHRVRAANRLHARLRQARMLDLALLNQFLHRAGDVFDRHVRVDAMLIEEIDGLDLEPLQRGFGDFLDVLRPAVQASPPGPPLRIELETELRGDHHLVAQREPALRQPAPRS